MLVMKIIKFWCIKNKCVIEILCVTLAGSESIVDIVCGTSRRQG